MGKRGYKFHGGKALSISLLPTEDKSTGYRGWRLSEKSRSNSFYEDMVKLRLADKCLAGGEWSMITSTTRQPVNPDDNSRRANKSRSMREKNFREAENSIRRATKLLLRWFVTFHDLHYCLFICTNNSVCLNCFDSRISIIWMGMVNQLENKDALNKIKFLILRQYGDFDVFLAFLR